MSTRRQRRPTGRCPLGRGLPAIAAALFALAPLASNASATALVGAGAIRTVASPGIALHVPADGRIDGDGFAVDIAGYRFAYQVGYGSTAKNAASGQALLVFALTGSGTNAMGNLEVDGQGEPLPSSRPSVSKPAYFLASVPEDAQDVALEISANGFSQTFSFTKGHREGVQPTVLYRGLDQWDQVDSIGQVSYVATPDKVDGDTDSRIEATLTSATLTYFLPSTGATPASPAKAWVVLSGSALPNLAPDPGGVAESGINYLQTLPGSDLTLTLPGQKPMPAMLSGQGGPDDESGQEAGWGLFGGDYCWQVPAGVVAATFKLNLPAHLLAEDAFPDRSPLEVPVEGQVPAVHVAFTPPRALPAVLGANPPAWDTGSSVNQPVNAGHAGAPGVGGQSATGKSAHSTRGGPVSVLVLLIMVALVVIAFGAATFYTLRSGRLLPALAGVFQTPAQRRAAEVEAFLPAPRAPAVRPAGPVPPVPPAAAGAQRLAGSAPAPAEGASPARAVEASSTPVPVTVLVPVPDGPAQLPEGAVELQLIGRVRLAGDVPAGAGELSEPALEALAALALRAGQPVTREELRALLGAGRETDRSAGTVSNYLASLRRVFGPERVPDASGAGGYRVVGIGTDFARFHELVRLAKAETESATRHLADALSLVRGVPFSGVAEHSYGWADRHDLGAVTTKLLNAVHRAAVDLAALAIAAGDGALATWATEKGLNVWHEDEDLDELYLSAAAISSDRSALARAWAAVKRPYDSRSEKVPTRLDEHYQSLRKRAETPS